ncbi:MAG: NfeD family protein [Planctomycetaceae bacterium]
MSYEALALLLMIVGFALIVAEVFIPSGGMIMILCICSFAASVWFAHRAWWGPAPAFFWSYVGALALLIPAAAFGAFRMLERTALGRRMLLSAPTREEVVPYQNEVSRLQRMIGQRGDALSLMTPGGMVRINGERLHAVSEGTVIEPGAQIEVMDVKGTRVVVRAVSSVWIEEESASPPREPPGSELAEGDDRPLPLDFDFPQG